VNADDPTLASVTDGLRAHRICFGLDESDPRLRLPSLPHAVDATVCRRCGHDLVYDALYSAHLGAWRCPSCGNARPRLDVVGRDIVLDGVDALRLAVEISPIGEASRRLDLAIAVPGLYNAYNAVAAVAAASASGSPTRSLREPSAASARPSAGSNASPTRIGCSSWPSSRTPSGSTRRCGC
jgi:UDP-N-acetylmuramyl tripeptide synthase